MCEHVLVRRVGQNVVGAQHVHHTHGEACESLDRCHPITGSGSTTCISGASELIVGYIVMLNAFLYIMHYMYICIYQVTAGVDPEQDPPPVDVPAVDFP